MVLDLVDNHPKRGIVGRQVFPMGPSLQGCLVWGKIVFDSYELVLSTLTPCLCVRGRFVERQSWGREVDSSSSSSEWKLKVEWMEFKFDDGTGKSNPAGLCAHLLRSRRPLQGGAHGEAACLTQPLSQVFLSIQTTDVQSPSIHSTPVSWRLSSHENNIWGSGKGPIAQESMLPNKSEWKPLPPHELLVYERVPPTSCQYVSPSLICLGQDIALIHIL